MPYGVAVRFRTLTGSFPGASIVQRDPPITLTVTVSGSGLVNWRSASVGWPLTSLTPNTSALGNVVDTVTPSLGTLAGASVFSSVPA